MPFSPLVSKIRCHNPNRKGSKMANRNYLTYIATREGVDISNVKDINDLLENNNIIKTELNDNYVHMEADNDKYLKYIAERPRSHGLFGNVDTSDLGNVAKQVADLSEQGRCIYRGIISLSKEDAEKLGFTNKKQWDIYMKKVMPDIAKELGVSMTNFTWVAAYHAEKTHPHVHYELWDNTNKVKSPFIHTSVQHKCRQLLSDAAFDNDYENMIKEIYKSERDELNIIRNESRRVLTDTTKDIMSNLDIYVPGLKKDTLTDRISIDEANILSKELIKLVNILPVQGSTDYAFLNPEVKYQVNEISKLLLKRFDMNKEFNSYLKAVDYGQKIIGKTKFEINIAKEKAEKDVMNRIGNIIVKKAKSLKEYENSIDNAITTNYEDTKAINLHDSHLSETEPDGKDMYLQGKGIDENRREEYYNIKALQLLQSSAEQNNSHAAFELGKTYANKGTDHYNIHEAEYWYLKASESGNQFAKYQLGKLYYMSNEINRDINKAINMLKLSAEQGNDQAQFLLGKIYANKETEHYNIHEAEYWYLKASESGNQFAQFQIGKMYLFGNDLPKNEQLGTYWLKQSIEQGNEYALKTLEMYDNYKEQVVPGTSYELIKLAFNMISNEKQKSTWNVDKKYRSRSKQAIKEEAMRQEIQGQKYDYNIE